MALPVGELYVKIKMDLSQFRKDMNTIKKMLNNLNKDISATKNMSNVYNNMFRTILNGYNNLTRNILQQLRLQTQAHNTNARLRTQLQLQQLRMQQQNTNNAHRLQMQNIRLQAQGNRQLSNSFGNVLSNVFRLPGGFNNAGSAVRGLGGSIGRLIPQLFTTGGSMAGVTGSLAGLSASAIAIVGVIAAVAAAFIALAAAAVGAAYAIGKVTIALSEQGLQTNASLEANQIAIEALIGDTETAKALFQELQQLSVESPTLRMEDVMYGAQQLAPIFKESAGDIVDVSKIIGDAVATTGEDAVNNYKGVVKALAQMYTKEQLTREEIQQQLADRGVPGYEAVAVAMNITTKEVMERIQKGEMKGREFVNQYVKGLEILRKDGMLKMGETWIGQVNIMKESWKLFVADLTSGQFEEIKAALLFVTKFVNEKMNDPKVQETMTKWKGFFTDIGKAVRYLTETLLPPLWSAFMKFSNWFLKFWEHLKIALGNWMKTMKDVWKVIGPKVTDTVSTSFSVLGNVILFIIKCFTWFHDIIQIVIPFLIAGAKTIEAGYLYVALGIKKAFIVLFDWIASAVELLPLDNISALSKALGKDLGFLTTLADLKETTVQWRKDINKEIDQVGDGVGKSWDNAVKNAKKKVDEMRNRKWEPDPTKPVKTKDVDLKTTGVTDDEAPPFTGDDGAGDGMSAVQRAYQNHKKKVEYMLKTNQWGLEAAYNSWSDLQKQLGLLDEASAKKKEDGLEYFRQIEMDKADIVEENEKRITDAVEEENKKREKEIEDSYNKRRKEIEDFYKDIENKEDEQDLAEKRRRLIIKRQSYIGATSAEGLVELAKVNQEIADVDKEITKKARDIEKETKLSDLEKNKEDSLKSLETQTKETISGIEAAGNAANVKLKGFLDSASKLKDAFFKAGKGLADGFVQGFGTLTTSVKGAMDTVASNSGALSNPRSLLASAGVVNNFNGPLVNVQSMYVKDSTDVTNISKEMYRTAQKSATAKGGRM